MSNTTKTGRPHEEDVIRYDENGDPLKTPIYPDEVTEQWMTGSNNGTTTPSPTPTTPVTTPSGTTPTTTVPMNYDVFLNQQRESAYKSAEAERARAEKAAETARQKQIIDAQNAYKTGLSTYGANAEAAASMGLTGSGYGEYLTGKAYATQRGEVASANRTAAALKEQALYNEQSAKNTADAIYAEGMINYGEKQKVEGENAYTNLSNMAASGATLEQITNSAGWGRLTPEQQTVISRTVSENTLMSRLKAGESLESLMLTDDWNALDDAGRTRLQNYATGLGESAYAKVLDMINGGTAISDIENLSVWTNLSEPDKNRIRGREAYLQAEAAIGNGLYDAESITTLPGYEYMSEADKTSLNNQIAQRDKQNTEKESAYEDENYRTVLGVIGTLSAESIRNLKAYKDIKDPTIKAEIDRLIEEQEKEKSKDAAYDYIDDVVSGDVKVDELDVTPETKTELKTQLNDSIKTDIKNGSIDNAINSIEANYKNGNLSLDEYQSYNVEIFGKTISASVTDYDSLVFTLDEIDSDLRENRISVSDAESLKEYARNQLAVVKSPEEFSSHLASYQRIGTPTAAARKVLDALAGDTPADGTAVYYNGTLYYYNTNSLAHGTKGWNVISPKKDTEYNKILDKELESNKSKAPTHKEDINGSIFYKPDSNTGSTNLYGPMKP